MSSDNDEHKPDQKPSHPEQSNRPDGPPGRTGDTPRKSPPNVGGERRVG